MNQNQIKLLFQILDFETDDIARIKFSFLDPETREWLKQEKMKLLRANLFEYLPSKTYPQLKLYHAMLEHIIIKSGGTPTTEAVEKLDIRLKSHLLEADWIDLGDISIADVPLKRSMAKEQLSRLIFNTKEKYVTELADFAENI